MVFSLFLGAITFLSCSIHKPVVKDVIGIYQSKDGKPFTKLEINKDNTFSYQQVSGLYDSRSKGKWKLQGSDLILISDDYFKSDMIEVIEKENIQSKQLQLYDSYKKPFVNSLVKFKVGNLFLERITNEKGIILIDDSWIIDSFYINTNIDEVYSYSVKEMNTSFEVILYIDDLSMEFFNNEKLVVNRNSLVLKKHKLFK